MHSFELSCHTKYRNSVLAMSLTNIDVVNYISLMDCIIKSCSCLQQHFEMCLKMDVA